jgi:hypothetical protein
LNNLYENILNLFACTLKPFKLQMTVLDVNFLSLLEKTDEWTDFFQINMNIFKNLYWNMFCVSKSNQILDETFNKSRESEPLGHELNVC